MMCLEGLQRLCNPSGKSSSQAVGTFFPGLLKHTASLLPLGSCSPMPSRISWIFRRPHQMKNAAYPQTSIEQQMARHEIIKPASVFTLGLRASCQPTLEPLYN